LSFRWGVPLRIPTKPNADSRGKPNGTRDEREPHPSVFGRRPTEGPISCDRCSASTACAIVRVPSFRLRPARAAALQVAHRESWPRAVFAPLRRPSTRWQYRNRFRNRTKGSPRRQTTLAIQHAVLRHPPPPRPPARYMRQPLRPNRLSGDYDFHHYRCGDKTVVNQNTPWRQNSPRFPQGIDHALLCYSSQ
jgi:hypothetical protein